MTLHKDREVPDEWKKAIIVALHEGKGSKNECNNYREISLLCARRVLTEGLMEVTEGKVRISRRFQRERGVRNYR